MSLEEVFQDREIIRELCRARIKLANNRREALFFHNICSDSKGPNKVPAQNWGVLPEYIFPARRRWHRFRRRQGRGRSSEVTNLEALERAVHFYRRETPDESWVVALNQVVAAIRDRALSQHFQFRPPEVILKTKNKEKGTYRALTVFQLEDKIIDCLVARYLRKALDHALPESCLAFRALKPMPSIHSALKKILEVRSQWAGQPVFVSECDIKGFYDCVSHVVARDALGQLILEAKRVRPNCSIDPQAIRVFESYLSAYSFEDTVLASPAVKALRQDGNDPVPWHAEELRGLHRTNSLPRIGVPQGGALSCLIANAVLFCADQIVEMFRQEHQCLYMRYCDDMILITSNRELCEELFEAYVAVLGELKLPVHPGASVGRYSNKGEREAFWNSAKSKRPYCWGADNAEAVPWIQFVGYQVRWDGLVRIRPSSLKKEREKIVKAAKDLLSALHRSEGRIRRTRGEITHRFRQKLISMAVGRARISEPRNVTLPMCWTNGFRGLIGRNVVFAGIQRLDRTREHEIRRVEKALLRIHTPESTTGKQLKFLRFYGCPFSYCGRFMP